MESTLLIAKVLGVYFMVSGVFIVVRQRSLALVLKDLFAHRALTYILGAVMVLGSAALILARPSGTRGLEFVITVVLWAILVKGLLYIFVPEVLQRMVKKVSRLTYTLLGLLVAAVGYYLVFSLG